MKANRKNVIVNLSLCKYQTVEEATKKMGFGVTKDNNEKKKFTLLWMDKSSMISRVQQLENYQVINHFPFMFIISRRSKFVLHYRHLKRTFPDEFHFHPKSFVVTPSHDEYQDFCDDDDNEEEEEDDKKEVFYIYKSNRKDSFGNNMCLVKDPKDLEDRERNGIIQEYIDNPLLIENRKFDIRMFLLITCVDPLTIFLFKKGIVRLSPKEYVDPSVSMDRDIHITRFNHHKLSHEEGVNEEEKYFCSKKDGMYGTGCQRDFVFLKKWMEEQHGSYSFDTFLESVEEILIKTVLVGYPKIKQAYEIAVFNSGNPSKDKVGSKYTCFEVLGVDLMLDQSFKPYLLDISHSPNYKCYTDLEREIKPELVLETLLLLGFEGRKVDTRKENWKEYFSVEKKENKFCTEMKATGFRRIFPTRKNIEKFSRILDLLRVSVDSQHQRDLEVVAGLWLDIRERIEFLFRFLSREKKEREDVVVEKTTRYRLVTIRFRDLREEKQRNIFVVTEWMIL